MLSVESRLFQAQAEFNTSSSSSEGGCGNSRTNSASLFQRLGKRGLLDLLGMRKTVGTSDTWPPPRRTLEATFETRHRQVYTYSTLS